MNKKVRSLFKIDDSLLKQEISGYDKRINLLKEEIEKERAQLSEANDIKTLELMIPFSHLGKGKTFGELALQVNKENPHKLITRAATITCITKCKFATMSK